MHQRRVQITGMGKFLPPNAVFSEDLDRKLNLPVGTIEQKCGVHTRYHAGPELGSVQMGAAAALAAITDAQIDLHDIDAIVATCGTEHQPLPYMGALIKQAINEDPNWTIPAFDIGTSCLSFLSGLDVVSYMIDAGRFHRVLLVASDKASVGLQWQHIESAGLFGDGAVAMVVEKTAAPARSRILNAALETHVAGVEHCRIRGGGSGLPGYAHTPENTNEYLFQMDGRQVFRMAAELTPAFLQKLLAPLKMSLSDIHCVVPHQASTSALALMQRRLNVSSDRWMQIVEGHGNMISASIPLALYEARQQGRIHRGDTVLLLGTSAGMSIGGLVFEY